MNHKFISDVKLGDEILGFYILKDAYLKTTASGKPFLSGIISDKSGSTEIKVWDYSGPISSADAGKVVKIQGEAGEFKGVSQISVSRIRLAASDDQYDVESLVATAPIDTEKRLREVLDLVSSITDDDYRIIAQAMLEKHYDTFSKIPAAKTVHHGFLSGLLMHTSNMLRLADHLARQYNGVINRSLMLAGTLLHDLAKDKEFVISELGLVKNYSIKGDLLGHLVMGAQEVAELARETSIPEEKSLLLQHMLLSHHGEPEFGAAVKPMCAEAELLYYIDLIDSRMEIYEENLSDVPVGEFSGNIFALGKKIYHHS